MAVAVLAVYVIVRVVRSWVQERSALREFHRRMDSALAEFLHDDGKEHNTHICPKCASRKVT